MKTMEEARIQNMSDINLVTFLRDYAKTRSGEIRALTLAAGNRILDKMEDIKKLEARIAELEADEGDDGR